MPAHWPNGLSQNGYGASAAASAAASDAASAAASAAADASAAAVAAAAAAAAAADDAAATATAAPGEGQPIIHKQFQRLCRTSSSPELQHLLPHD